MMKGVTYDKTLCKWRARSDIADGRMRVGAYDTEKDAEDALIQYRENGLLPMQKRRGQ